MIRQGDYTTKTVSATIKSQIATAINNAISSNSPNKTFRMDMRPILIKAAPSSPSLVVGEDNPNGAIAAYPNSTNPPANYSTHEDMYQSIMWEVAQQLKAKGYDTRGSTMNSWIWAQKLT